jgi:hypothetical protein
MVSRGITILLSKHSVKSVWFFTIKPYKLSKNSVMFGEISKFTLHGSKFFLVILVVMRKQLSQIQSVIVIVFMNVLEEVNKPFTEVLLQLPCNTQALSTLLLHSPRIHDCRRTASFFVPAQCLSQRSRPGHYLFCNPRHGDTW